MAASVSVIEGFAQNIAFLKYAKNLRSCSRFSEIPSFITIDGYILLANLCLFFQNFSVDYNLIAILYFESSIFTLIIFPGFLILIFLYKSSFLNNFLQIYCLCLRIANLSN